MEIKRRRFLIALGVVPPLMLEAACKIDNLLPTTIITGKVIDENNMPVEGWRFTFAGYDSKASVLNPKITFSENIETNIDGKYKFSIIVPQNSSYVSYGPIGFVENGANDNLKKSLYNLFIEVDGKYEPYKKEVSPNIGQANTFNYQIKKK